MAKAAEEVGFVHLHVHSSYSLLEGALKIPQLADLARADDQPALALTDTGNLFGALEFSDKLSSSGIQPIIGCSLAIKFGDEPPTRTGLLQRLPRIVLLAADERGYRELMALVSSSHLEVPDNSEPHVTLEWLAAHSEGLLALTGGPDGPIDKAITSDHSDLAKPRLESLRRIYGERLYVELQRHSLEAERIAEPTLVELAYELKLPLVATNEPYFSTRADYEAHDALISIAEGRLVSDSDRRQLTPEHRFKTRAEMMALFADLPEALVNSVEIAKRCSYWPKSRAPILPHFSLEGKEIDEVAELRARAEAGLAARIKTHGITEGHTEDGYRERLSFELDVIIRMNYAGYFLIVSDFIQWAKKEGIPVGPGRGSGAGSLVAYALTITDLDPIRFGLLFERFLNPERVSMPDFDIDFCQNRRDEVIRYVQERYGREQVAQIITFGSLQARGVMRDVGRVLEMPYGQVDRLCKLIPINPAHPVTLKQAVEDEPRLQEAQKEDPRVKRAFDIALKLEGLYRHASTHAAGIVIGDRPLSELVPLYRDPKSDMPATQFNMKWVEKAGLVKFDFLGLKTLTVIETAVNLIRQRGVNLDIQKIPLDDVKSYEMISKGDTVGVFQIESSGMRKAIVEMRPDRFEDIIALVALYRPGPMANIPTYNARKHGYEQPDYIHPKLEEVLKETFGVIVYQEQVMQAAQLLAGYSLGDADLLRRAMGKKIRAEMQKQGSIFVEGCAKNDIPKAQAEAIFELLERFADYGFNKSHAAAYALVAYQTAYMKANYPVEFLAASMTLDMGNTDKLSEFRAEAERLGIKVEPPSVNRSAVEFGVEGNTIIYALAALKGVGRQAVESILEARGAKPFADLADFAARINPRAVNKRVLESLAQAGAFDEFDKHRARVFGALDKVMGIAQRTHETQAVGQNDFFGGSGKAEPIVMPNAEPWLPAERLKREYEAIGFFLSGHPLDDYAAVLKKMRVQSWAEFSRAVKSGATAGKVAGTVVSRQERRTKTGNKMGIFGLSDPTGAYEAVIFSEGLAEYRDLLEPGRAVLMVLSAEVQGDDVRARIQSAEPLDQAAANLQKGLRVFLREAAPLEGVAKRLEPAPARASGAGEVSMILMLAQGTEVEVKLDGRFKVSPQIAGAIKAVPGVEHVEAL